MNESIEKGLERHANLEYFLLAFNWLQREVHEIAVSKGWWDADINGVTRSDAECLCLMHSELSEALEGLRHGNPASDKLGAPFTQAEEELADLVIRTMDLAEARQWRIAEAIIAKMQYNRSRPHKHGKKF